MRLTSASLTRASDTTLLSQTQPAYDAANNVVNVQTSISGATDTQQFCYDSLNRLTWAGATGTPPCASLTPGTLTAAQYQQSDAYNVDGGLTSGPSGSYTYGDSSHPHAVTATSTGYSAAYDAVGNLTCRAPSSSTTCSGTQMGQQLGYDAQGRLTSWQNTPTSPTQTANYLYDGAGKRVAMQTTVSGTTTTTAYIGSIEEIQQTGSTTQTTTYYMVVGKRIAANVNGAFYYFGCDALGSQVVVLNSSGNIIGSQLYGPYGSSRYSNGTLPTSIGFTGQRVDSVSGLDYYVARYYDPMVGQFLSVDTVQGNSQGTSPYVYVGDNPETKTDPTGQRWVDEDGDIGWINPDGRGGFNLTSITYLTNRAGDHITNHGWLEVAHLIKPDKHDSNQTYEIASITAGPVGGRSQVECLLLCGSNGALAAAGGTIVLNPAGESVCVAAPELCAIVVVVAVAAVIANAFAKKPRSDTYNQVEDKQWKYILQQIARRIGRQLTKDEQRRLHDEISQMHFDVEEIIEIGVSMFGR